ncbi:hypothetical protein BYT27DRAFT_7261650 [Phlegmacium glaucopus]|nr:hypothetical protein BYT27DRAFT_7261650 [Phlegmacium glaucopus]
MTGIQIFRSPFSLIPLACPLATALKGNTDNNDLVHLIVTAKSNYQREGLANEHDEQHDWAGNLTEIRNILSTKGRPPSQGAKSIEYPAVQADPHTAIHDGCYPPNATFPTVAPPLKIFHRASGRTIAFF